jgi:two-component system chemotaxis response regulator CheB
MMGRDLIVVGASAGGLEALVQLVRGLPPGLPAAVCIVCHFPPGSSSALPDILSRHGPLLARHARADEPIYPAHIYVAPPDYHLLVEPGVVRLDHGPRENRFRPAIDPLFRSAARAYGPRVIGVLLSGGLGDGIAGLLAVRGASGLGVIQDPADAICPNLPRDARTIAGADHVAPAAELGRLLTQLLPTTPNGGGSPMTDSVERITQTVAHDMQEQEQGARRGTVSLFSCPECGGCMWQLDDQKLVRFRCHVGHAYAAETLLDEQSAALEAALWTAVRTFREKAILSRQLAGEARVEGQTDRAQRLEEEARLAEHYGELIQQALVEGLRGPPAGGNDKGTG